MEEENKDMELLLESFENFLINTMLEVQFASLVKETAKEIQENFRDQVITLPDYIGKKADRIRCIYPTLEIYLSKENIPEIAVLWDTVAIEMFIFKNRICSDAFRIPTDKIEQVMSHKLWEKFLRHFNASEEFYKESDKKSFLFRNRGRLN